MLGGASTEVCSGRILAVPEPLVGELIGEGGAQERVAVGETLNWPRGFRLSPLPIPWWCQS